ncbi:Hydrogen peroxide-inducible genes activator [Thermus aquaticus]|jgi:LysR family hydrogen peroxide-inducible transcriptional activator|uniref:Hydrogen peroxide-inducible genes activator n=1 Tax=Thermus aquaticus TaxID=271 RepID=A0A0M9AEN6_THEAQ|nr:hydrogen peroxide-inducible genes activator [Thermus aquaticus]KOX89161.1 Hydrogen peroxide-inducible genes activator [Thermus aquaticus]
MRLTLDQLRSLVALAEEGSFTLAAERVYLSQPALSIQIRKLEEALGAKLFDRKKGTLTEAGRVAVAQARRVLEEVERLTLLVRGEEAPFQGPFRLGVIPTLTPYLLPRLLPKLQERYPGLELEIREDLTPNLVQALQEGGLDAGLVGTEENHPGLRATPLFREAFWAYVSPNHWLYSRESIHPLEIPQEDTWVLSEGHCLRDQVLSVCRPSLTKRRVEFQSGSLETLLLLVEGVGGLTLLPEVALWTLPEAKRAHLRPLTPPGAGRTVYLLLREGSLKTRVAQGVAEEAVRTFQALRLEAQA